DERENAKWKALGGVTSVRRPHGVGVVAETPWAAFMAREELTRSVTWTRTGTAWGFDSDRGLEDFAVEARNLQGRARPNGAARATHAASSARRRASSRRNTAATTPIMPKWNH